MVIPTRHRETRLAFVLEALAAQTLSRKRFEVVVVRAPDAVDGQLCKAPAGLDVRFLTAPVAGPAAQRNLGWRATSAPLVAFTDDDCRPAAEWLERLVEARGDEATMLQGRTEPDPQEAHLYWGLARSWELTSENEYYATCNMAYPRALLERLGGFDERFPSAWGEDTDLGLRAREQGATQTYVDNALTWHAVLPRTLGGAIREARRLDGTVLLVARHPDFREQLHLRYFTHGRHARLLLALSGLALGRRRPALALLAWAPYLYGNVDRRRLTVRALARSLGHLPVRLGLDLAEIGVLVRGSIRERVLLL